MPVNKIIEVNQVMTGTELQKGCGNAGIAREEGLP
jgi:hypothetical protein